MTKSHKRHENYNRIFSANILLYFGRTIGMIILITCLGSYKDCNNLKAPGRGGMDLVESNSQNGNGSLAFDNADINF